VCGSHGAHTHDSDDVWRNYEALFASLGYGHTYDRALEPLCIQRLVRVSPALSPILLLRYSLSGRSILHPHPKQEP
jgi:hypothetical protein